MLKSKDVHLDANNHILKLARWCKKYERQISAPQYKTLHVTHVIWCKRINLGVRVYFLIRLWKCYEMRGKFMSGSSVK